MTIDVTGEHTYSDRLDHVATIDLQAISARTIRDDQGNINYLSSHQGQVSFAYGGPAVEFETQQIEAAEGQSDVITVKLSETSPNDITVRLVTSKPSQGGADYLLDYRMDTHDVTIPAGQLTSSFVISHLDDNLDEWNEGYFVEINRVVAGKAIVGNANRLTGKIIDSAAPEVFFVRTYQEASEGHSIELMLGLTRAIDATVDVTIAIDPTRGDTIPGIDYLLEGGVNPVTVTFQPLQQFAYADVSILVDGLIASGGIVDLPSGGDLEPDERFFVTIVDSGQAQLGEESSFEGLISSSRIPSELQIVPQRHRGSYRGGRDPSRN